MVVAVATAANSISNSISGSKSELVAQIAKDRAEDRNATAEQLNALVAQMNALVAQIAKDRAEDRNATAAQAATILEEVRNIEAMLGRLPEAFRSVAVGLHEAAGGPVYALVAADHIGVEAWLTQEGYGQYALNLAPLGGAALLLSTKASLMQAGVAAHHISPLLVKINGNVRVPPAPTHADADDDSAPGV